MSPPTGLLVIDRKEATVGLVTHDGEIKVLEHLNSSVPRKHHRGGQSSLRFERLIEIATVEYYEKVSSMLLKYFNEVFPEDILLGGPGSTKDIYMNRHMPPPLTVRVLGRYDTGYTDEYGLRELVEAASEDWELERV